MALDQFESRPDGTGQATPEALVQRRLRAAGGSWRTVGEADRGRPLRLSAGQQQMWLLHQFDPMSPAYLMSWVLRVSGPLDAEGLRWAWEKLICRHEILRTRYASGDDWPVQIIDPPARFELRTIDLTEEPPAGRETRARQIAEWERTRPVDLTADHPVAVTLLVLGPDLHFVVIRIHHIACDGVSYRRIADELSALYAEHTEGPQADLPQTEVQYADFAAWELAGRTSRELRSQLDYWRTVLGDVPELPLPLDRPRTARPGWRGGAVDIPVKPATGDAIVAAATQHRASPYMVMLAAYHVLLAHLTGSVDVPVGIPVDARTVPELDGLIGYLVNTVVVRSRHEPDHTFADLLAQVRDSTLDALDHRAVPFMWMVDEVNPARATGATPLFQVAFDMASEAEPAFGFPPLRTEQLWFTDSPAAKFDLTMHVEEAHGTPVFVRLEFATAVIDKATAEDWAAYFEAVLEAVLGDPREPLARVRQRLLERGLLPRRTGVPETTASPQAPVGAPQALLTRIHRTWCEVLGNDRIDVRDNFFDVGGDSLSAVALAGKLKADGLDVSATDIFAYQTVEELAQECAQRLGRVAGRDEPAHPDAVAPFALITLEDRAALPEGVVDAYPLAAMQLGMLIEQRARPDVNLYQDSTSYQIHDDVELDAAALQQATQLVVDRHEILRTTFDLNNYLVPLQLVHRTATITVGVIRHGVLGPEGWLPKLTEYAARERGTPMDLACAPLIRVRAHTADDSAQWWITITECHPILEGWSFHTILMEILTGYREIRAGRAPAEPEPVPFRYADYIAAEAASRQSEQDRAYWRGVVEGRTDLMLPSAWRDDAQQPRDRHQHIVGFRDLEGDLRRLATETRTSLKAVLLAAHLKVMSMIGGERDLYTGVVADARPEVPDADRVLGMYLNTVPFPMPAGARTWGELVKTVYDGLTGMWPHRVFPMQVIQQEFGLGGRLLEVYFIYLDFHHVDHELVDRETILNDNENEFALHVSAIPGALILYTINHCLSREAAVRLAALYRTVLEQMALGPHGDAGSSCLPWDEQARLRRLAIGRQPAHDPPTFLESFGRTVRERPDDPAARCGDETLTYQQLDAWARAVARRLRACDVGPGSVVAVAPQRDLGTVAALVAVWMAGAAWLPIEPEVLAARLREPGGGPDVSAVVTAGADGTDLGAVPVVVARAVRSPGPAEPETIPRSVDLACVLPTGLTYSHGALAHALANLRDGLEASGSGASSWLCAVGFTSAAVVSELLMPLACGAVVVVTTSTGPDAIGEMTDLVTAGTVTGLRVTPLVARRLVADGRMAGVTMLVGGDDEVNHAVPAGLGEPGRLVRLVKVDTVDAVAGCVALDGRLVGGIGARVVDADLRPVATGVVGELCVAGAALADGRLADPAYTAERFVPDPMGRNGSRLYRTGRLARFTGEGVLEHLGPVEQCTPQDWRATELYRVRELLDAQPSVLDSCVLFDGDPSQGGRRLIGYVRMAAGAAFDAGELRRALAASRLSRQLIPEMLLPVDDWPRSELGTIDRDRLPKPSPESEPADRPWDEVFETLLRDALDGVGYQGEIVPDIALADFGLGSFSSVGLLVAIEQSYGITIPDDFQVRDMLRTARTLWETVVAVRLTD